MDKEKFIKYVRKICEIYNKAMSLDATLERELNCTSDVAINLSNVHLMTQMLDDWCGYEDEWVEWYVFESDGGHKECFAYIYDDKYPIESPDDLWQFLAILYYEG